MPQPAANLEFYKIMKFSIIPIAAFFTAAALSAEPPSRLNQTVVLDETGIQNLGIETVESQEASFENTVMVLGQIDHTCESHTVLSSRIPGRLIDVGIHEGEFTAKGDIVARVESRQPGDPPPSIELRSPGDGLVIRSDLHLGGPVEPDKELLEILDLSTVWAVAKVPQAEASILKEGLVAKIRVPALGTEIREAKFLRLGVGADAAAGTVEAIFEMPNAGNKLRPGMLLELSLIASKRDGVLSIPRAALQGDRSSRFVFIKDYDLKNSFVKTPVVIGEASGDRVEITKGLFPGDEVVTNGAYALAFAGKGNASLKEALDAAHGHPHNEDGTEMTKEEIAAGGGDGGHAHHGGGGPLTLFLAIICGVLFILLLASPFFFRNRSKA